MPFTYEQKEIQGEAAAQVTGYEGEVSRLRIPEQIDGLRVLGIGSNAFSWREDIKEAILPEHLRVLGGFAFYNSKNLQSITLCDGVEDYHDGVIRHCKNLSEIRVNMTRENYALVKALLGDNDRMLRLVLDTKKETICLTFPEYFSDYIEDTRARAFHTKIEGAGYRYRECVTGKGILYQEYDEVFIRASSYDGPSAARIALDRLMFPHELSAYAKNRYEEYLRMEMESILPELIDSRQEDVITFLARRDLIGEKALEKGIILASKQNAVSISARLMEAQQKVRKPAGRFVL